MTRWKWKEGKKTDESQPIYDKNIELVHLAENALSLFKRSNGCDAPKNEYSRPPGPGILKKKPLGQNVSLKSVEGDPAYLRTSTPARTPIYSRSKLEIETDMKERRRLYKSRRSYYSAGCRGALPMLVKDNDDYYQ